ncbi:MAG: prepilin-type N-terminal cleavage/methylation domain-containing protein [Candidatus Hydrogenedentes bacterium]|nr:prepilin-type N-terminal cleavage/methylation domain-containing protein [Candidatus Hydrogenedentota bacterium]
MQPFERHGFSLLELIVVLTILAVMSAAVVPLYRNSLIRSRGNAALQDLLATLKYAQQRAVTDTQEYRVYLNHKTGHYWAARPVVTKEEEISFETLGEPGTEPVKLPEGVKMSQPKARKDRDQEAYYISFYPSGACDVATVALDYEDGKTVRVQTKGKIGPFEVKEL